MALIDVLPCPIRLPIEVAEFAYPRVVLNRHFELLHGPRMLSFEINSVLDFWAPDESSKSL